MRDLNQFLSLIEDLLHEVGDHFNPTDPRKDRRLDRSSRRFAALSVSRTDPTTIAAKKEKCRKNGGVWNYKRGHCQYVRGVRRY